MTPSPRLVPDRPSDAAIAQALCSSLAIDYENLPDFVLAHAREIDAAAPPAEAPAERGDVSRQDHALELLTIEQLRTRLRNCEAALADRDAQILAAAPAAPADGAVAMLKRIRDWGFSGRTWSAMRAPTMEDVEACILAYVTAPRVTGGREVES